MSNSKHGSTPSSVRRFGDLKPKYGAEGASAHEQIGIAIGARICSGVVFLKDAAIPWKLWYDEVVICHAANGVFEIEADGRTEQLNPGDMIWLPSGTSLIYRAKGEVTFFYAVTPADWEARRPADSVS